MKNKTTKILLALLAVAFAVSATMVFKYCLRIVPSRQCSEVYRRYCDRDDLKVRFIKDYHFNDTLVADVTIIAAKDSTRWFDFLTEMNVNEISIKKNANALSEGRTSVIVYYSKKNHPDIKEHNPTECSEMDLVFCTNKDFTMYIFDIESLEQGKTIKTKKIYETF